MLYYPAGQPRPEWSYTVPFSAKDKAAHFHERKFRILTLLESDEAENVDHKLIPTVLNKLIQKVVVHPASSKSFSLEVRNELKACGIPTQVAGSQWQACDLQAMT